MSEICLPGGGTQNASSRTLHAALAQPKVADVSGVPLSYHVLDYFTRPADDNPAEPLMLKLLTTSRYEGCATADAFLDAFGDPILNAYGTLDRGRIAWHSGRVLARY